MKIGVCTTDFTTRPAEKLFADIEKMGFDNVQFAFSSVDESEYTPDNHVEIPPDISYSLVNRLEKLAANHSLPIICVNGTWNMAHKDADLRSECRRRMELLARATADLGAKYITICTGTRGETLWSYSPWTQGEVVYGVARESLMYAAEYAQRAGVTLLIETEASNVACTPELAKKLIEETGGGAQIVLDPANLFLPGQAARENAAAVVENAIETLAPHIRLAHGKDIMEGKGLNFCGAFEGIVDFPAMLESLSRRGINCDMVLHGIYEERKMPDCLRKMREAAESVARKISQY